jgi:tRNA-modifying protein YgfZ
MRQQRTDHLVWRVTGDDPLGLLEATTTQHVADLEPGQVRPACLLEENGRIQAFLRISRDADGVVYLDGAPAGADGVAWVAKLAPLSRCEISQAEDLMVVRGAEAADGALVDAQRFDGLDGRDSLVVANDDPVEADIDEEQRIAHGWPRFGIEVTDQMLLNDTPLLELATSFTKGCYRGQETVAKIRNLGHARRRRVRAHAPSPEHWMAGVEVSLDGTSIGTVGSATLLDDEAYAIATVKSEHAEAVATIGGKEAKLEPIVLADAPPPPPPPSRTLRLGMKG